MSLAAIHKHARVLKWLITVPLIVQLTVTLGVAANVVWHGGRDAIDLALCYIPMALYTWAIWMIRRVLKVVAAGEVASPMIPTQLSWAGFALFVGAIFREFGYPLVVWLIGGNLRLQVFEATGITLAAVGLSIVLFAQLLKQAAAAQQELDEFI
jgi:hypothetical protein